MSLNFLKRDEHSRAIINMDEKGFIASKKKSSAMKQMQNKIRDLENRISDIEQKI